MGTGRCCLPGPVACLVIAGCASVATAVFRQGDSYNSTANGLKFNVFEGSIPFEDSGGQHNYYDYGAGDSSSGEDGTWDGDDQHSDLDYYLSNAQGYEVVKAGTVIDKYACRGEFGLANIPVESRNVDVRELVISTATVSENDEAGGFSDFMNGLRGDNTGSGGDNGGYSYDYYYSHTKNSEPTKASDIGGLHFTDPVFKVFDIGSSEPWGASRSKILQVQTERDVVDFGAGVGVAESKILPLAISYVCLAEGEAVVETWLTARNKSSGKSATICMRWLKQCSTGWPSFNLQDAEGQDMVRESAVVTPSTSKILTSPVKKSVTDLYMSSEGLLRLRHPYVTSYNENVVTADFRSDDIGEAATMQVTRGGSMLLVEYQCKARGTADIGLTLERDFNPSAFDVAPDATKSIEVRWKKYCSSGNDNGERFESLMAHIKSSGHKNSTLGVKSGITLPGFLRPCPRKNTKNKSPPGRTCYDEIPMLTIPIRETKTEVLMDTVLNFPALAAAPLISYNQRILEARVGKLMPVGPNANTMSLSVRYLCFQDGVSNISVTLYWDGFRPTDVSWKKRCMKPTSHVSRQGFTAPQLLSFVLFAVAISGTLVAVACYMRARRNDRDLAEAADTEKASIIGNKKVMDGKWEVEKIDEC